jgi:hypothetical protein
MIILMSVDTVTVQLAFGGTFIVAWIGHIDWVNHRKVYKRKVVTV